MGACGDRVGADGGHADDGAAAANGERRGHGVTGTASGFFDGDSGPVPCGE